MHISEGINRIRKGREGAKVVGKKGVDVANEQNGKRNEERITTIRATNTPTFICSVRKYGREGRERDCFSPLHDDEEEIAVEG